MWYKLILHHVMENIGKVFLRNLAIGIAQLHLFCVPFIKLESLKVLSLNSVPSGPKPFARQLQELNFSKLKTLDIEFPSLNSYELQDLPLSTIEKLSFQLERSEHPCSRGFEVLAQQTGSLRHLTVAITWDDLQGLRESQDALDGFALAIRALVDKNPHLATLDLVNRKLFENMDLIVQLLNDPNEVHRFGAAQFQHFDAVLRRRLHLGAASLLVNGMSLWECIFCNSSISSALREMKSAVACDRMFHLCVGDASRRLTMLTAFSQEMCRNILYTSDFNPQPFIIWLENTLDRVLREEERFCMPTLNFSVLPTCAVYGLRFIQRKANSAAILKADKVCTAALAKTSGYMRLILDPVVSRATTEGQGSIGQSVIAAVLRCSQWFDPGTLTIPELSNMPEAMATILCEIVTHERYNSRVQFKDGVTFSSFALARLAANWVMMMVPSDKLKAALHILLDRYIELGEVLAGVYKWNMELTMAVLSDEELVKKAAKVFKYSAIIAPCPDEATLPQFFSDTRHRASAQLFLKLHKLSHGEDEKN